MENRCANWQRSLAAVKRKILNTLAQKDRYIQEWELLGGPQQSHFKRPKTFPTYTQREINRSVYQWYQQQQSDGHSVTGPMLQREARLCAANLGITTFAASNGWLANFRRFYNIVNRLQLVIFFRANNLTTA